MALRQVRLRSPGKGCPARRVVVDTAAFHGSDDDAPAPSLLPRRSRTGQGAHRPGCFPEEGFGLRKVSGLRAHGSGTASVSASRFLALTATGT